METNDELVYKLPKWRLDNGGIPANTPHTFGYIIGAYSGVTPCPASVSVDSHICEGDDEDPPCQYPGLCESEESEESGDPESMPSLILIIIIHYFANIAN